MACNTYQNTHFYYKNNNEESCDRIGGDNVIIDSTAWPSSYYGQTKRIDLAKVYSDTLLRINQEQEQKRKQHQQQQQQRNKKGRRQVSFTTAPPIIHEYEKEDIREYCRNRKRYDEAGHLRIQTLDLRPIPNNCYNKQRHHRHQRSVSSPPTSPLVSPNYSLASPISSSSSSSSPTKSLSKSLQEQQPITSSLSLPKTSSKKLRVDYDEQTTNDEENNILLLLLKQPIRTRSFNISTFLNFKSFKMK